jgi:thymidine phosphorylase
VPSIPLITASILSKKLAENLDALILDVKFGCAAFMPTRAAARQLARSMVALGNECGTNTRAILTDMNTPLGRAAGNWLEVKESVACLEPGALSPGLEDLRALVVECAVHLLLQTRRAGSPAAARRRVETCLQSGAPRRKWDELLVAQGADLKACHKKLQRDSTAGHVAEVTAGRGGYVAKCDARIIGEVIRDLGGGRLTQDSTINYDVGVDQLAKPGDRVERSGRLCRVHAADAAQARAAAERLRAAFELTPRPVKPGPRVVAVIR